MILNDILNLQYFGPKKDLLVLKTTGKYDNHFCQCLRVSCYPGSPVKRIFSKCHTIWGGRLSKMFCNMFSGSSPWAAWQLQFSPAACGTLRKHVTKPFPRPAAPDCIITREYLAQVHTEYTPFKCDLCDYRAKTKTIIKMHRTLHFRDRKRGIHAETDVQCDQVSACGLSVTQRHLQYPAE